MQQTCTHLGTGQYGPHCTHPHVTSCQQGNRERYYEADNSLLDCVLSQREGIPISLALLHAAVGARARGAAPARLRFPDLFARRARSARLLPPLRFPARASSLPYAL